MAQQNEEASTPPDGTAPENTDAGRNTEQPAGDGKDSLEDPEAYDAYQEAMGELGDGDEAASMGGPAI